MNNYRIFETDGFVEDLDHLDTRSRLMIEAKLKNYIYPQLRSHPYSGTNIKKLHGFQPDLFRYRVGEFRIFYLIENENKLVKLIHILPRKDAYR